VPKARNTKAENAEIKSGKTPSSWHKHKASQKDVHARWVKKRGKNYFGYKSHISVDRTNKLVRTVEVSDAAMHDSQMFYAVVDPNNSHADVYADSAYRSKKFEEALAEKGYRSKIHFKAKRGESLKAVYKSANRIRSSIRARVEHIFGHQVNSMHATIIRNIGHRRARSKIILMNLAYNMKRYLYLEKTHREGAT